MLLVEFMEYKVHLARNTDFSESKSFTLPYADSIIFTKFC